MKLLALLGFACWHEFALYTFMMIFLLCVLLWRLMYCDRVILFNSCFNLSFSIYCLTLRIFSWGWWLSSSTVSLVLLAHTYVISLLRTLVRSQRSEVGFLVKLWVNFVFIRNIRLNTILLLVYLVLTAYELAILKICSLNSVELLWLKRISSYITILIASIQELLIDLRLVFLTLVSLTGFDRRILSRISLCILQAWYISILHLLTLHGWVHYLREISLSSDLLSVKLRWGLVLVVLRAILRKLVEASSRCAEDLRRAKSLSGVRVLVVVDHLLELPLIVIILDLCVVVQASPHLVILLLPS